MCGERSPTSQARLHSDANVAGDRAFRFIVTQMARCKEIARDLRERITDLIGPVAAGLYCNRFMAACRLFCNAKWLNRSTT